MYLTGRETAQVLAALRFWQANDMGGLDEREQLAGYGHFEEHDPMCDEELNVLCETINVDETPDMGPNLIPTDEYRQSEGWVCPRCTSRNVSAAGKARSECGSVHHDLICGDCETAWREHFELSRYEMLEDEDVLVDGLCEDCRVEHHDACGMVEGCSCCKDTMENM